MRFWASALALGPYTTEGARAGFLASARYRGCTVEEVPAGVEYRATCAGPLCYRESPDFTKWTR